MSVAVEAARLEWEESHRRLQQLAGDRVRYNRLSAQVERLTDELRRRVGQTFTLDELAAAYTDADRWAADALGAGDEEPSWPAELATVEGAAFHRYARGAVDYAP
jgi:hypothetical protein